MTGKDLILRFKRGTKSAFSTKRRVVATTFISALSFILIALLTSIGYSYQMFSSGIEYWLPAISLTVRGIYWNNGILEFLLNILYSGLIGVTVINTYLQMKSSGLKIGKLSGIAPAFLIAGCAGCGIGILSLIGLTGVIALLPFQGTGIKLIGIIALIYFIARTGKPEICSIPSS